ncbi:NlpC/P60 family protein [uncultured Agrococcus sp.]|uniref:C40 family peptidase n=1 Tax=uncultured Agrococcus sp. TaxID=382258 RepID=UPI0025D936DC|nr:NlpC/P60 family protein [uncultured Agrococcus sp.]
MKKSTDLVVQESTASGTKRSAIGGFAKKAGIVALAVGFAGGVALPAVAFNDSSSDRAGLESLYAGDGQGGAEIQGETVVLTEDQIVATTPDEYEEYLEELRAEEEAERQAEEEQRQQEESQSDDSDGSANPSHDTPDVPGGGNQAVVDAALAQLGVNQDCFALMRSAVAAGGYSINSYADVFALQQVPMSEAKPGDILYYQNGGRGLQHVAIYLGNGQAVHGGWYGSDTVVASVNVGSGPIAYSLGG